MILPRSSVPWMVAAGIAGALMLFGILLAISAPEAEDEILAQQSGVAEPSGVSSPASLPFAGSVEPASETELDVDARMASLARLAKTDPVAAARSLGATPTDDERTIALRTVFREWAVISPQDALAWASTMDVEHDRNEALEFVCYRVAENDPKQALDLARQAGAGTATQLVQDLVHQWAGKDVEAAGNWAMALPAGGDRDRLLARVCQVLSGSDPAAAGAIVSREIAAGPVQDEAAMSVIHQWAMRDFAAASEWVASFPRGTMRDRAEEELRGVAGHPAGK